MRQYFSYAPVGYQCPFCCVAEGTWDEHVITRQADVFYRDEHCVAFISSHDWPENHGNAIIIPLLHAETLLDLPDELVSHIAVVAKRVARAMVETYGCQSFSVRQHNGPDGNQDVWHYHFQVFPRWSGDELYPRHREKRPADPVSRAKYAEQLREWFARRESEA